MKDNEQRLLEALSAFFMINRVDPANINSKISVKDYEIMKQFQKLHPEFDMDLNGEISVFSLIATITEILCGEKLMFVTGIDSIKVPTMKGTMQFPSPNSPSEYIKGVDWYHPYECRKGDVHK